MKSYNIFRIFLLLSVALITHTYIYGQVQNNHGGQLRLQVTDATATIVPTGVVYVDINVIISMDSDIGAAVVVDSFAFGLKLGGNGYDYAPPFQDMRPDSASMKRIRVGREPVTVALHINPNDVGGLLVKRGRAISDLVGIIWYQFDGLQSPQVTFRAKATCAGPN